MKQILVIQQATPPNIFLVFLRRIKASLSFFPALFNTSSRIAALQPRTCALALSLLCFSQCSSDSGGSDGGSSTPTPAPTPVSLVSAGDNHTCAVKGGALFCWGNNSLGQLGDGSNTDRKIPVAVKNMGSDLSFVSAGSNHTCAVKGGELFCWGSNNSGQLGDGSTTSREIPVAVLGVGGSAGDGSSLSDVSSVAGGGAYTCAVKGKGGALFCWGNNSLGQLGDGSTTTSKIPVAVSDMGRDVSSVTAGDLHACAVKGGALFCWGTGNGGELGDGSTTLIRKIPLAVLGVGGSAGDGSSLSDVSSVSGGGNHTCAVKGGALFCWGRSGSGQLGDGSTTNRKIPVAVLGVGGSAGDGSSLSDVSSVSGGGNHTCAVKGGALFCWGKNNSGRLGDGSTTNRKIPLAVLGVGGSAGDGSSLSDVSSVAAGDFHTCAIKSAKLYCWGDNGDGRLGDGTTAHKATPVAVNF